MNPSPNRPATEANGRDWKTLPWVLILLGTLILASQFLNPGRSTQSALQWYETSGLRQLEWENYLSWLRFNGNAEQARALETQLASGNTHAYAAALLSEDFVKDSDRRARDFWSAEQIKQWSNLRSQVPYQLAQSPLYRWGLSAAQPRPSRFFTAPFTGSSIWLTLLSVAALAMVALRLERQLGHGRIIVLWIAGSLISGAGYLMLIGPGETPFHGASAPLMCLLGAAASLSRQPFNLILPKGKGQQLNLTLPAWSLVLVPLVMLGAIAAFQSPLAANVAAALLAGIGGAILALLIQPQHLEVVSVEDSGVASDPEQQLTLTRGWDALGTLDGVTAERHFRQALSSDPHHFDALTGLFTAQQIQQPVSAEWHQTAATLFSHDADEPGQATQIAHYWKQYKPHASALPEIVMWQLVITLSNAKEFALAEQLAATQSTDEPEAEETRRKALEALRAALMSEGLTHRAKAITT